MRKHYREIVILILLFLPLATFAQTISPATPFNAEELDKHILQEMKASHIPGISLAIFSEEKIIYRGNYGTADPTGRAITSKTPFVIGSLSKLVTAYAIMQLIDKDKLALDTPVRNYLPWFRPINPFDKTTITINHLLTHTSGIPGIDGIDFRRKYSRYSLNELLHTYEHLQLNRPVGDFYEYSNANYNLLGGIIQKASGQSYAEYIRTHIFEPFHMKNSYISLSEIPPKRLAQGYQLWFRKPIASSDFPFIDAFLPSMTIISSSEDMAKFLMATLTNREGSNESLLSEEIWKAFYRPSVKAELDGYQGKYAFGSLTTELYGKQVIFCQGGYSSFRAYAFIMPQDAVGFVILMNINTAFSDNGLYTIAPNIVSFLSGGTFESAIPETEYGIWITILMGLFLFEIVRIIRAPAIMKRWKGKHRSRRAKMKMLTVSLFLPALIDAILILGFLFVLPRMWGIHLNTMMFIQPDLTLLVYILCAIIALFCIIRTSWGIYSYADLGRRANEND